MSSATLRASIARPATFTGIGVHSGEPVEVRVLPAPAGSGISFRRVDMPGSRSVQALWNMTGDLMLCTTLQGIGGVRVSTIEHLMAAFAALGVDDVNVEVDGPELPILDGSAAPFLNGLRLAGTQSSGVPRTYIEVTRPVEVRDGDKWARLAPYDGYAVSVEIDFADPAIGRSTFETEVNAASFARSLAAARTFGLARDVDRLRAAGLARGGSLDNAIVVQDGRVLNPGGLRFDDEFVRHKVLDVVGDLHLAGAPILGRFTGVRTGHALNNALLRKLMNERNAWRWSLAREPLLVAA